MLDFIKAIQKLKANGCTASEIVEIAKATLGPDNPGPAAPSILEHNGAGEVSVIDRDAGCYMRAKTRGQATFTLVAQDESAPATICDWITRNIETAPGHKLHDALESALQMRNQLRRKPAD